MTRLRLALVLTLVAPAALAQPCTTSWTNAAGGVWTDDANWDNDAPTAASVACITLDGTYTVTVGGFSVDVLRLGGASGAQTLANAGNVAVGTSAEVDAGGVFEWSTGYYSGGPLTNDGQVLLTGTTNARGVNGATFRNQGTVEHSGSGIFYVYNGGRVENAASWTVSGDGDVLGSSGAGTFVNEATGTVTKSGAGTVTAFTSGGLVVENAGALAVASGELRFQRPSTHTDATLTTSAGGLLRFDAGGVTFAGTVGGAQAGTLALDDGVTAAPATWAFTGAGIEWTADYLNAGELTNTELVRLTGATGSRGVRNAGVVFRNEGAVEHADTGAFYVYADGRAENAGLWEVTGGGDVLGFSGPGTFVNGAGATFTKSGAGTLTTFANGGLVVENAGQIRVEEGELDVDRPFDHQASGIVNGRGTVDVINASPFVQSGHTLANLGGPLVWQTDWSPSAGSVYYVRLAGLTPGAEHSQLAVAGTATLAGTLDVYGVKGFALESGQSFTVLTCGTACQGSFDAVATPIGVTADVAVDANEVVLTITSAGVTISRFDPVDPVVVGPEGGTVRVRYVIANPTDAPVDAEMWTTLTLPSGETVEVQRASPLMIPAADRARRGRRVELEAGAPNGDYTLRRYVGTQGVDTLAVDAYTFSKAASVARATAPSGGSDAGSWDGQEESAVTVGASGVQTDEGAATAEEPAAPVTETVLQAPYPNPASGRATVAYELAEAVAVRVTVYDALGREVARVVEGPQGPGRYAVPFETSWLPPGVYVVRLAAGAVTATRQMTVVR